MELDVGDVADRSKGCIHRETAQCLSSFGTKRNVNEEQFFSNRIKTTDAGETIEDHLYPFTTFAGDIAGCQVALVQGHTGIRDVVRAAGEGDRVATAASVECAATKAQYGIIIGIEPASAIQPAKVVGATTSKAAPAVPAPAAAGAPPGPASP